MRVDLKRTALNFAVICLTTLACVAQSAPVSTDDPSLSLMRNLIETYSTDLSALRRYHNIDVSTARAERLRRFYEEQLRKVGAVDFNALDQDGRIDYLVSKTSFALSRVNWSTTRSASVKWPGCFRFRKASSSSRKRAAAWSRSIRRRARRP